ncbi:hypothetical protein CDD81_5388 [Ophiocordyceps australis]|uniref:NIMA interactive protein n=1 Tax=Ophiocordyceps australis TaxID=1399860 RepID=A0A2C5YAC6_9HYPO|nr:hypothetical protein CDD81_5388 [Ophiocordyceps australis]
MIDTANLRTASLYINNQLLSRGLLRDGQTIDFANLGHYDDGVPDTASRIIKLVNDLILRRDRDAENRESLSMAMREVYADNTRHVNEIARLGAKNEEERRKADTATAAEATLRTQLKTAEATTRGLKDEVARAKSFVSQARAACAVDVRRRDRQIDTLKKQLSDAGRARGTRTNPAVTAILVTGDFGLEKEARNSVPGQDVLRTGTNTFLSQLARRLGEENEMMLDVVQRAVYQLRSMSGCEDVEEQGMMDTVKPRCEDTMADLDRVMEHMRELLTSPRFVPIEEAIMRQKEIERLQTTISYMEARWAEFVQLMEGWRKALATNGRAVCEKDLEQGLRLSPVRADDDKERQEWRIRKLAAVAEEEEDEEQEMSQHSPCPPSRPSQDAASTSHPEAEMDSSSEEQAEGASDSDAQVELLSRVKTRQIALDEAHSYTHTLKEDVDEAQLPPCRPLPSQKSPPLPGAPRPGPLRFSPSAGNRGTLQSKREQVDKGKMRRISVAAKSLRSLPVRPRGSTLTQTRDSIKAKQPQQRPSLRSIPPSSNNHVHVPTKPSPATRQIKREAEPLPALGTQQASLVDEPAEDEWDDEEPQLVGFVESHAGASATQPCVIKTSDGGAAAATQHHKKQSPSAKVIAAKLAASEREADATRVRARLRAARACSGGIARPPRIAPPPRGQDDAAADDDDDDKASCALDAAPGKAADDCVEHVDEDMDPVKQPQPQPEKRKRDCRTGRVAARRRSTLSPWELQALISGSAQ